MMTQKEEATYNKLLDGMLAELGAELLLLRSRAFLAFCQGVATKEQIPKIRAEVAHPKELIAEKQKRL